MAMIHSGELSYFRFDTLDKAGVVNACFSRRGGVSPEPWGSLNMGGTTGDQRERVRENHRIALDVFGLKRPQTYDAWQVHGADVILTERARPDGMEHLKADVILTGTPGVYLFMRFADCTPILLAAPNKGVVGIVHAGWQGTLLKAVQKGVTAMHQAYGVNPGEITAAIGPAIGSDHYEVGEDLAGRVLRELGQEIGEQVIIKPNGRWHLDLWKANELLLRGAGVEQIEHSSLCTACHIDDWYSHRLERGKTGRFGVLIGMPE